MDKVYNQEIFASLIKEFLFLQLVVAIVIFFVYKLYANGLRNGKQILLVNILVYIALNLCMIYQIYTEPDLRIGGISFAFEMYSLFLALLLIIILLLEYVLLKFVIFKVFFKKSNI
jgi:hypothetical protein